METLRIGGVDCRSLADEFGTPLYAVSYTHLDVYKRQVFHPVVSFLIRIFLYAFPKNISSTQNLQQNLL